MPTITQLFNLKLATLEKRLATAYDTQQDADLVLRQIALLLIRERLSSEAFSDRPAKELLRSLYLTPRPLSVWQLRLSSEFAAYFSPLERLRLQQKSQRQQRWLLFAYLQDMRLAANLLFFCGFLAKAEATARSADYPFHARSRENPRSRLPDHGSGSPPFRYS